MRIHVAQAIMRCSNVIRQGKPPHILAKPAPPKVAGMRATVTQRQAVLLASSVQQATIVWVPEPL